MNGKIQWCTTPDKWPFILVVAALWKGIGYNSILYLSALSGISQEMLEAARIDGATKMQEIFKIKLPHLVPNICILPLLGLDTIMTSDTGLYYQATRYSS